MKRHLRFLAAVLLAPVMGFAQQTINYTFNHDGLQREFILYVPASYNASEPTSLILSYHGTGGTSQGQMEEHDFRPVADTAGFIVAHPQGYQMGPGVSLWNIGSDSLADDIGFTSAMIDTIAADFNIDRDKVYAAGKSLGGFFSLHLAGQLSNEIAAVCGVSATMTQVIRDTFAATRPVPFLQIHGTADPLVPYNGNQAYLSVDEVLDFWIDHNNCNPTPTTTPLPDLDPNDGSTVEHIVYANGDDGTTVEHLKVIGGRHTWPSENSNASGINFDINGCQEIWEFFSRFDINGATGGTTGSAQEIVSQEQSATAYPNPFRDQTTIAFTLNEPSSVSIDVYDLSGRVVTSLFKGYQTAGEHRVVWNPKNTISSNSSGLYFYRLQTENEVTTGTIQFIY